MSKPSFFISQNEQDVGPVPFEQLIMLMRDGKLGENTLVRLTTRQEYIKLGDLIRNMKSNNVMRESDPLHGIKAEKISETTDLSSKSSSGIRSFVKGFLWLLVLGGIAFMIIAPPLKSPTSEKHRENDAASDTVEVRLENESGSPSSPDLTKNGIQDYRNEFISLNILNRKIIQSQLKSLGHYKSVIDGVWGPSTASAVSAFADKRTDLSAQPDKVYGYLIDRELRSPSLLPPAQPLFSQLLWNKFSERRIARLKIQASSDTGYFIKVRPSGTKTDLLAATISPGGSLETEVPLGSYDLVYATGDTWYGEEALFGHNTQFYQTDRPMIFSQQGSTIKGVVISLVKRAGGNLRSNRLNSTDF